MAARTTKDKTNLVPPWGLMAPVLEADLRLWFLGLQMAMALVYVADTQPRETAAELDGKTTALMS